MAEDAILGFLQTNDEITDSHEFAAGIEVDHTYLVNVIKRLNGFEILEAKVLPFGSLSVENVEDKVKALLERLEDGKVVDGNNVADLSKESLLSHSNACYHINFTFSNFDRNR
ncbi:hypothetical protein BHE74_00002102 [Ensete ventricosum]|nr:hypothetical protein BHE74_00002102 [Ensete ventricosum]